VSSALQVDGVLLSYPGVAEAVAFAAPDEKFGEVVAAAVVPSGDVADPQAFIADLKKHAATKLAKFKVQHFPKPLPTAWRLVDKSVGELQSVHLLQ
jgi:acyl-coenzyme A synthetase/AMP-(fatty) acid ligase